MYLSTLVCTPKPGHGSALVMGAIRDAPNVATAIGRPVTVLAASGCRTPGTTMVVVPIPDAAAMDELGPKVAAASVAFEAAAKEHMASAESQLWRGIGGMVPPTGPADVLEVTVGLADAAHLAEVGAIFVRLTELVMRHGATSCLAMHAQTGPYGQFAIATSAPTAAAYQAAADAFWADPDAQKAIATLNPLMLPAVGHVDRFNIVTRALP